MPRRWLFFTAALAAGLATQSGWGKDQSVEFLRQVRQKGYGEVALDFLDQLQKSNQVPAELKETWDLEMHYALKASVGEAYQAKERADRQQRAQEHLDKFLKEHPNHPAAAGASESAGEAALAKGAEQLAAARLLKDKQQQTAALSEARKAFEAARPSFTTAAKLYAQQLAERDAAVEAGAQRRLSPLRINKLVEQANDTRISWLQSRFQLTMVDYLLAQTYFDEKDPKRRGLLQKAGKAWEDQFQENRGELDPARGALVGLAAHMWFGKCTHELGELSKAKDVYDEVLSFEPDNILAERNTGLEPVFARVWYFRFLADQKEKGADKVLAEAKAWIEQRKLWRATDGFQGIAVEVVKGLLAAAEKASGSDKGKLNREAMVLLRENSKVRSEFQAELLRMLRELTKREGGALSFDDALAQAREAVAAGDWEAAVKAYGEAVALGEKARLAKDKAALEEARHSLHAAEFRVAGKLLQEGKVAEAGQEFARIAREFPTTRVAPAAAAMSVKAALTLYATVPAAEKEAALAELNRRADYTLSQWPDKAEADDARIAKGQAALVKGQFAEALRVFESVNDRSERYPMGLYLAGQTHFRLFLGKRTDSAGKTHLAKAAEQLAQSLQLQLKAQDKSEEPPRELLDTQLLLAEVQLENAQPAEAVKLVRPLLETIKAAQPKTLDASMRRTAVAAVRGYLAAGNTAQAGEALALLSRLGEDAPDVNRVLFTFCGILDKELKQRQADLIGAAPAAKGAAQAKLDELNKLVAGYVGPLAKRQQMDTRWLLYIADLSTRVGELDAADKLYQQCLEKARTSADPQVQKSIPGIRARLIAILREKKEFEPALVQINEQLKANPRALDLLMEKGRILQARAEQDPTKFEDAVAHWNGLRRQLEQSPKKGSEYYEVVLNVAGCLVQDARNTRDQEKKSEKAGQAGSLLHAVQALNPSLSGPDMVARFKELASEADEVAGVKPKAGDSAQN